MRQVQLRLRRGNGKQADFRLSARADSYADPRFRGRLLDPMEAAMKLLVYWADMRGGYSGAVSTLTDVIDENTDALPKRVKSRDQDT